MELRILLKSFVVNGFSVLLFFLKTFFRLQDYFRVLYNYHKITG